MTERLMKVSMKRHDGLNSAVESSVHSDGVSWTGAVEGSYTVVFSSRRSSFKLGNELVGVDSAMMFPTLQAYLAMKLVGKLVRILISINSKYL
jgi:hypothetical protein